MHVVTLVSHLLHALIGLVDAHALGFSFGSASDWLSFVVQAGGGGGNDCDPCPGSQFTQIGASWANIGYMTHSDFLHYVGETKFGLWAPLIYVAAGIGALVGVAIGAPPRTYMWFMLGPAIYSFLIGTTQEVKGVDWVVAGRPQEMKYVWRDAEVGMRNTDLVKRLGITVNREKAPSQNYKVATAFLYLDELLSATTNLLVEWTGLYRQEGEGGNDSNLAKKEGEAEGPWYLLSNLKWGMLENVVGVSVRNPDLRDALITFLASECGEKFKQGISSGRYMAAAQSRGSVIPNSVMKQENESDAEFDGSDESPPQYDYAIHGMDVTSMPTPRSLVRLFTDNKSTGSFGKFSKQFEGSSGAGTDNKPIQSGRGQTIVCSEYLYTLIQAFRWESGHAYHQLVRTSPRGLTKNQFLKTLFYGWDIRKDKSAQYASDEEMAAFVKMAIFTYLLRNELLYAPQITSIDQRYAPSEQARSYSEAYVRTFGSKSKFAELFQWAVLMPHLQGVLLYLVIIAYPFASMLMILPGYWKAFYTWASFFAWLKLWDVGFAMVQVLERSVWAMIGNHSNMARIANMLIQTAEDAGSVGVSCNGSGGGGGASGGAGGTDLPSMCAVPNVCSVNGLNDECGEGGEDQDPKKAWALLDRSLLIGSSIDLDLSNGYYIYIMAALYFAVPAITGQLILGARAGASGLVQNMIGGSASEAGRMAATGAQHQAVAALQTNQASLSQAAYGKSMRQGGLAGQYLDTANAALDTDMENTRLGGMRSGISAGANAMDLKARSFGTAFGGINNLFEMGRNVKGVITGSGTGAGTGQGAVANRLGALGGVLGGVMRYGQFTLDQDAQAAQAVAAAKGTDIDWGQGRQRLAGQGLNNYAQKLRAQAQFAADSSAWEARNAFGAHASSAGGIAGMNSGALAPGWKPTEFDGMAMSGMFGGAAEGAARYSGTGFMRASSVMIGNGQATYGSNWVNSNWGGGFSMAGAGSYAFGQAASVPGIGGYVSKAYSKLGKPALSGAGTFSDWLYENVASTTPEGAQVLTDIGKGFSHVAGRTSNLYQQRMK